MPSPKKLSPTQLAERHEMMRNHLSRFYGDSGTEMRHELFGRPEAYSGFEDYRMPTAHPKYLYAQVEKRSARKVKALQSRKSAVLNELRYKLQQREVREMFRRNEANRLAKERERLQAEYARMKRSERAKRSSKSRSKSSSEEAA